MLQISRVWRFYGRRVNELVGLYKQHMHGRDTPDWNAFMRGVLGNDVQLKVSSA